MNNKAPADVHRNEITCINAIIHPSQYGNNKGGYCFALWSGHSAHLGRRILLCISVAIDVKLLKLKTCLIHKNCISIVITFILGLLGYLN